MSRDEICFRVRSAMKICLTNYGRLRMPENAWLNNTTVMSQVALKIGPLDNSILISLFSFLFESCCFYSHTQDAKQCEHTYTWETNTCVPAKWNTIPNGPPGLVGSVYGLVILELGTTRLKNHILKNLFQMLSYIHKSAKGNMKFMTRIVWHLHINHHKHNTTEKWNYTMITLFNKQM